MSSVCMVNEETGRQKYSIGCFSSIQSSLQRPLDCLFFLPLPYHPTPSFHTVYQSTHAAEAYIIVPNTGMPENTRLGIHVYVTGDSKEVHENVQYRLGTAWIPVKQLTTPNAAIGPVDICNELGNPVGTLTLTLDADRPWMHRVPVWDPPADSEEPEKMLRACSERHHPIEVELHGHRYRDRTGSMFHGIPVPIWMFQQPGETLTPVSFYLNAAYHACAVAQVSVETFKAHPLEYPEVLGQFLGYYAWSTPYRLDRTEQGTPYDQFAMIRDMPDRLRHSGDCEDAAREMQLTWYWLMHCASVEHDTLLSAIKTIALRYTAFTVDATLKTQCLHHYVKLFPWAYVHALLEAGDEHQASQDLKVAFADRIHVADDTLPVLVVESTARCYTASSGGSGQRHSVMAQNALKEKATALKKRSELDQHTRVIYPVEAFRTFYEYDVLYYNPDWIHRLRITAIAPLYHKKYGCPSFRILTQPQPPGGATAGCSLRIVHRADAEDMQAFEWLHRHRNQVPPLPGTSVMPMVSLPPFGSISSGNAGNKKPYNWLYVTPTSMHEYWKAVPTRLSTLLGLLKALGAEIWSPKKNQWMAARSLATLEWIEWPLALSSTGDPPIALSTLCFALPSAK